jgi:Prion-inhibition and propagation
MGISGDISGLQLLRQTSISEHEIKEAEDLLGLVLQLMKDAKGVSDKFVRDTGPNDETLLVCDARAELEHTAFPFHNKMSSLCLGRQARTGLQRKIKWALYEEKHFRKLIDDITHFMDKLVTLFPSIHSSISVASL